MTEVTLPYRYAPTGRYAFQLEAWKALEAGTPRAVLVWHRRAGKDKLAWNWTITAALTRRVGVYYYFFPTFAQARRVLWEGLDEESFPFLGHIPESLLARRRDGSLDRDENELRIRLVNGSVIQLVGTDRYDAIRGTNPVGVVYSEYSYQDPKAWDVVRPILTKNGGWAIFVFTPNGRNHAWDLWQAAHEAEGWFTQRLTIADTGLITPYNLDRERREGATEEYIRQEYYCEFLAGLSGEYYAPALERAQEEGRITRVPWEPLLPVITAWDIGIDDLTAIWFAQVTHREVRLIRYLEGANESLLHWVKVLEGLPYRYAEHLFPHDIQVRELTTGRSRYETLAAAGLRPIRVAPALSVEDGIEAVRRLLPRCVFDRDLCARGLQALRGYHRAWDEKLRTYRPRPAHDWASHGADAFRVLALLWRRPPERPRPEQAECTYDPFAPAPRPRPTAPEEVSHADWRP